MGRAVKTKKLENSRLLKEYASWIYCTSCGETIAYLCYVTYGKFDFRFKCNCGCSGSVCIDFEDTQPAAPSSEGLVAVKNRLCCPQDGAPLATFIEGKLKSYTCTISCVKCGREYSRSK